jgi:hypothetical protein
MEGGELVAVELRFLLREDLDQRLAFRGLKSGGDITAWTFLKIRSNAWALR